MAAELKSDEFQQELLMRRLEVQATWTAEEREARKHGTKCAASGWRYARWGNDPRVKHRRGEY